MKTLNVSYPNGEIKNQSLADLLKLSKYTVLYFYPKDNTPGCTLQAQNFTESIQQFLSKGIQIIWVSKDSDSSHKKFITDINIAFPLISDSDLELHNQFWTYWEKNNYGKISMWTIRSTFVLDSEWNIIKEYKNVKATGHVAKLLKEIADLI